VLIALAGSACIARLIQEFTPNKTLEVTCSYSEISEDDGGVGRFKTGVEGA